MHLPATSPATAPASPRSDDRLTDLIDAWGTLPEAVRAGIAAMVAAARTSPETFEGGR